MSTPTNNATLCPCSACEEHHPVESLIEVGGDLFCDKCFECDGYDYHTAPDYQESDEEMKARGAMDGDGFVVCGTCGKGGGAHATEDCPDQEQWSLECYSCDALLGGKVFDNEKEYDDHYAAAHFTAAGEWLCEKCK